MAAIRETLILEDKFTSTMTQCLQVAQRMANMLDDVRASTMNVETAAAATSHPSRGAWIEIWCVCSSRQ